MLCFAKWEYLLFQFPSPPTSAIITIRRGDGMVDIGDLKSPDLLWVVWVRVPPSAPRRNLAVPITHCVYLHESHVRMCEVGLVLNGHA